MTTRTRAPRLHPATEREANRTRVRIPASGTTDPVDGSGFITLYSVPPGFTLEVRRLQFDGSWCKADGTNLATTGAVPLVSGGMSVQYLRSGRRIEWGNPGGIPPVTGGCVPGVQTWGEEQGPFLQGGEVFQVQYRLNQASARNGVLLVTLEGILSKVGSLK